MTDGQCLSGVLDAKQLVTTRLTGCEVHERNAIKAEHPLSAMKPSVY